jgi:KDO2-lipid IV(A) lauroyltransferase
LAKFILGNTFRKKAFNNPVVRHTLWFLDLLLVGLLHGIFKLLPVTWASALGARLGRLFSRLFEGRNRHIRANLSLAFPEKSAEEIERHVGEVWANAGAVLAEYPHIRRIIDPRRDFLEIVIRQQIPAYSDPARPAVFVSAHLANWEIACSSIARFGIRALAMYAPQANPWFNRLMLRYRSMLGCELASRDQGVRPFVNALKDGGSAAMIIDRRVEGGEPIPFFGVDKPSSTLPARLALRFKVPLVPVQVERLSGPRFRVTFHEPLQVSDPQADLDAQALDLTRQIHEHYERWISARPGEWFCTKKIWPGDILRAKTDAYRKV